MVAITDDELPIEVEEFLSLLVTERGRAANTIAAYRRDLSAYTRWLADHGTSVDTVDTATLVEFVAERRAGGAAVSSVARQLAAVRTLHRYLVIEGERADDPTADLEGVRVPAGLPKPLSEADVTSLLDAVVGTEPIDLRDRALLELLYATGARISEACGLSMGDIDFDARLVRLFGKGSKERIVPFGRVAAAALDEWFSPRGRRAARAGAVAPAQRRRGGVPQPSRGTADPSGGLGGRQGVRRAGRAAWRAVAARAAALVRHAPARPRRRPARRPGAARARLDRHDAGVHEGQPGAPVRGVPVGAPAGAGTAMTLPARHLARRFMTSLSPRPPDPEDEAWVAGWLTQTELELWSTLSPADRRHSIEVARRFARRRPDATAAEMAGALLHDVGKIAGRPRHLRRGSRRRSSVRARRRFRLYHDHEAIGARLAEAAGADPVTVALIEGQGPAAPDLRAADDV